MIRQSPVTGKARNPAILPPGAWSCNSDTWWSSRKRAIRSSECLWTLAWPGCQCHRGKSSYTNTPTTRASPCKYWPRGRVIEWEKRVSPVTKNEIFRDFSSQSTSNNIKFKYVISDSWFSSKDNMIDIKLKHQKGFVLPVKSNRTLALSGKDKHKGIFISIESRSDWKQAPQATFISGDWIFRCA